MRIYFDTSVYSMIANVGDSLAVKSLLQDLNAQVLVSSFNIDELQAIPSSAARQSEIGVLLELPTTFEAEPLPYRHSMEVLRELRRLRPEWVRPLAFNKQARRFLAHHHRTMQRLRDGSPPTPEAYARYGRDIEQGNRVSTASQKRLRTAERNEEEMSLVAVGEDGAVSFGAIAPDDSERAWRDGAVGFGAIAPDDSERAWRAECLQCWHNAVVNRVPASRDYWDYLGPYLTKTAFGDPIATARFWLDEVDGDQTPLNRVTALTNHFQLKHKIGHGNQLDSLHACYLLDVDTFVTADKAFAGILGRLKTFFGRTARVLLIDRSSSSTVAELSAL